MARYKPGHDVAIEFALIESSPEWILPTPEIHSVTVSSRPQVAAPALGVCGAQRCGPVGFFARWFIWARSRGGLFRAAVRGGRSIAGRPPIHVRVGRSGLTIFRCPGRDVSAPRVILAFFVICGCDSGPRHALCDLSPALRGTSWKMLLIGIAAMVRPGSWA